MKTKSILRKLTLPCMLISLLLNIVSCTHVSDLERANNLNWKLVEDIQKGHYEEALPMASEVLSIREKVLGPEHQDTAHSLNDLATVLYNMGDYSKAEPLFQRALEIYEETVGAKSLNTAAVLNNLAALYRQTGAYSKAEPLYLRALAIREKVLGPEHLDVALCLSNLAVLYNDTGAYSKAEPLYQRALAIREKVLGPDHPDTAMSLNSLASLYETKREYSKAESLYRRALAIREKAFGTDHPLTANCLSNLAMFYDNKGDYSKAEGLYLQAIAIHEKTLGPEHPSTADCIENLAVMYDTLGNYSKAEALYLRALSIREKALGPEHPDVAGSLTYLGGLYNAMGDYYKAEPLYLRASAIWEKALGPEHPYVAANLNNLALLYDNIGDYSKAESLYLRAMAIKEKALDPKHPDIAIGLNNLAGLYYAMGDYSKAEPLYLRSLTIREEVFGPDHPNTASCLHNLAALYVALGNYSKAESLYQRALVIWEKIFGPEHPSTATTLINLAALYYDRGDYSKAEPLYQRALSIWEKALGPEHPSTAIGLNELAKLLAAKKEYTKAHELFIRSQKISAKVIDEVMGFTSEEQKIKFLATQRSDCDAALGLVTLYLPRNHQAVRDVLDVWLSRKGTILEAQRRFQEALAYSDNPDAVQVFLELSGVRSKLSRLMFSGPSEDCPESYRKQILKLESVKKELEARLSNLSQTFARQMHLTRADTESVSRSLQPGTVLVDFAQIQSPIFGATAKEAQWGPPHYLVFILPAGVPSKVVLLDLGEAATIDQAISDLKHGMNTTDAVQGKKASTAGATLYELVFSKIEKEFGQAKDIFISPDGNLNLIPFEVIRKPNGKYLIEEYSFNYLASGRDLIGLGLTMGKSGPPLLMGAPDFDLDDEGKKQITRELGVNADKGILTARRSAGLRGLQFPPLPGTGEEVRAIRGILGQDSEIFTGKEALEEVLASRGASPRILHLATHGFFLTDQQVKALRAHHFDDEPGLAKRKIENPLLRSGLALAGANRALEDRESTDSDGLFTAEEALGLKLQGTELVVLSACNTGIGDVKNGEGVYGLRRAFIQAGTKGLVMSMWSVPDLETKELMVNFYQNLKSGQMSRCQALRQAALKQMQITRGRYGHTNPFYWGAFLYLGEP